MESMDTMTGDTGTGGGRNRLTMPGIIVLAAGLLATVPVLLSDESLADRVAVDEATFNQVPRNLSIRAGDTVVELQGPGEEIAALRARLAEHGFPTKGEESSLEFALRAARFVQSTLRFGQGRINQFRGWGPARILDAAAAGEHFYCDSYARLLSDIVLTGGVAARPVWMEGHVTSEIYSPEDRKWVLVDAMYNFYATEGGVPLSVTEIRRSLLSGRRFDLEPISDPARIDEPSRSHFEHKERLIFGGSQFSVFDSAVSFTAGHMRILVPAISLATPRWHEGSSPAVRALRLLAPGLLLAGGLLLAAGRWTGPRRERRVRRQEES